MCVECVAAVRRAEGAARGEVEAGDRMKKKSERELISIPNGRVTPEKERPTRPNAAG